MVKRGDPRCLRAQRREMDTNMANKERATLFTTGNTVTRDLYIKTTRLRVVNIYLHL